MPTIPLDPQPSRFAEIVVAGSPPFFFDPAAVLALEPRGDGYALHLAGGQVLELTPAVARAVIEFLGLSAGRPTRRQADKATRRKPPAERAPPKRDRPIQNPKSKIQNPRGLLAAALSLVSPRG